MNKLLMAIVLLALAQLPAAAAAAPAVSMSVKYTAATGVTLNDLVRSLNRHRTGGSWAYTYWKVTRTGCRTSLVVRQTLPRWVDRGRAPSTLRHKWDSFYAALAAHEAQHVQFGRSAAAEVDRLSCTADYRRVVHKWIVTENDFDRRTRHGMKTGATLKAN